MGAVQDERVSNIDPSTPSLDLTCREPMLLRVNHVVDGDTIYGLVTTVKKSRLIESMRPNLENGEALIVTQMKPMLKLVF